MCFLDLFCSYYTVRKSTFYLPSNFTLRNGILVVNCMQHNIAWYLKSLGCVNHLIDCSLISIFRCFTTNFAARPNCQRCGLSRQARTQGKGGQVATKSHKDFVRCSLFEAELLYTK